MYTSRFLANVMLLPVRLSSICLSSVTLVRPSQAVEIFGCLVLLPSIDVHEKITEIVPGEPLRRGFKRIQRFWTYRKLYPGNGAR